MIKLKIFLSSHFVNIKLGSFQNRFFNSFKFYLCKMYYSISHIFFKIHIRKSPILTGLLEHQDHLAQDYIKMSLPATNRLH